MERKWQKTFWNSAENKAYKLKTYAILKYPTLYFLSQNIKGRGFQKKIVIHPAPFLYHFDVRDLRILQEFIFFFNAVCLSIDLFTFFPGGNQPSNMSDENEEKYL